MSYLPLPLLSGRMPLGRPLSGTLPGFPPAAGGAAVDAPQPIELCWCDEAYGGCEYRRCGGTDADAGRHAAFAFNRRLPFQPAKEPKKRLAETETVTRWKSPKTKISLSSDLIANYMNKQGVQVLQRGALTRRPARPAGPPLRARPWPRPRPGWPWTGQRRRLPCGAPATPPTWRGRTSTPRRASPRSSCASSA